MDKILSLKETELTTDKLNLLRTLKNYDISSQHKERVLYYLWECLTVKSTNIRQNIEEEIESVYRGFITTIKEDELKLSVIKAMVSRIKGISTVRNEMHLFREFILTYPSKVDPNVLLEEGTVPHTIKEVLAFLKEQRIYEDVLRLLAVTKSKDKVESVL